MPGHLRSAWTLSSILPEMFVCVLTNSNLVTPVQTRRSATSLIWCLRFYVSCSAGALGHWCLRWTSFSQPSTYLSDKPRYCQPITILGDPAFLIWVRNSFLLALTDLLHFSPEPHPQSLDSALHRLPACGKAFPLRAQSSISHCGVSRSTPPSPSQGLQVAQLWAALLLGV